MFGSRLDMNLSVWVLYSTLFESFPAIIIFLRIDKFNWSLVRFSIHMIHLNGDRKWCSFLVFNRSFRWISWMIWKMEMSLMGAFSWSWYKLKNKMSNLPFTSLDNYITFIPSSLSLSFPTKEENSFSPDLSSLLHRISRRSSGLFPSLLRALSLSVSLCLWILPWIQPN